MHLIIAFLYGIISVLFAFNLNKLCGKFKDRNNKITIYSLFATSSLIISFVALCIYFLTFYYQIVIIAQLILLTTMIFILYTNHKNKN